MSDYFTLDDACIVTTGKLDANAYVEGGKYPFYTCASNPTTIDSHAYNDDVILIAGNNAQGNFHLNRFSGKFNAYQRTYILTIKEGYNLDFIFYALKLELRRLKEHSQGSQTKFLTMPILTSLTFSDRTYIEQQKIASILSSLDKKIELNNKINQELEAMAKTLYDYWFVQFDFPDAEGKPYKSSSGKMVYSEALKREIPEGWEVDIIGNTLSTTLGGTPLTSNEEYWSGNIPWLNSGEIANFPIIDSDLQITLEGVENSATSLMSIGTVVISITRHLRPSILAIESCANQSVVGILESDELKSSYIYPFIHNEIPRYMTLRTGAQQPHINKKTIDETFIVIPSSDVLKKYYDIVNPMYEKINNIAFQNQKLTQLRDWLLPMLMNGQVKIADAAGMVDELMVAEPSVGYGES